MRKLLGMKLIVLLAVVQLLAVSIIALDVRNVKGQEPVRLKLINAATGENSVVLGNASEPFPSDGVLFRLNVTLTGSIPNLFGYQIGVGYNNATIHGVNITIPTDDPSFVLSGYSVFIAATVEDNGGTVVPPMATGGATMQNPMRSKSIDGTYLLAIVELKMLKLGSVQLDFYEPDYREDKNYYTTFSYFASPSEPYPGPYPFLAESFSVTAVGGKSPPFAGFTYKPEAPRANETIVFDSSRSLDADGTIVSYSWDFGDNTTALTTNETKVTHAYPVNGAYPVNLTVTDNDGLNGTALQTVQIGLAPISILNYTVPASARYWPYASPPDPTASPPYPGDVITFNATDSYSPGNKTIVSYDWDFGTGNSTTTNETTTTYLYVRRGVYYVNLTVTDTDGLSNSTVQELQIGRPPFPTFDWDPKEPEIYVNMTFTAAVQTEGGVAVDRYVWDFGDLNVETTNASSIVHYYVVGDTYNVTLTVYDADGVHGNWTRDDVVVRYVPPTESSDYTWYVVIPVIMAVIIAAVVIRHRRSREEEEYLDL